MPRPLRFIPEHSIVEITTRTHQGRLLLKPSPELTDIILGIIGKAQALYGMTIHAFVFLSTHSHFLLSPTSTGQLLVEMETLKGFPDLPAMVRRRQSRRAPHALFMQFANAKEAGRLHVWRERFWSRRCGGRVPDAPSGGRAVRSRRWERCPLFGR